MARMEKLVLVRLMVISCRGLSLPSRPHLNIMSLWSVRTAISFCPSPLKSATAMSTMASAMRCERRREPSLVPAP